MPDESSAASSKAERQGWLGRVLPRFMAQHRRDVIAANVGDAAHDVVVGKNIIQIGTFVVPKTWILLLLLGLLGAAGVIVWQLRGPTKMNKIFNVALAQFAEIDTQSQVRRSEVGETLSEWAFNTLQTHKDQYAQRYPSDDVEIWHDSLPWTQQGVNIGYIAGNSTATREARAAKEANDINAHVLLYGDIDTQGKLILKFYVSPHLHIPGTSNSIAGHYQFGNPIQLNRNNLSRNGTDLTRRTSALFWLIKGLEYDSKGQSAQALNVFREAEKRLEGWRDEGEGKEIFYFFKGQSALFPAVDAPTQAVFDDATKEAEEAFRQAIKYNASYIRAHIGLGTVHFVRAQCLLQRTICTTDLPKDQIVSQFIDPAIAAYTKALELAPQSSDKAWADGAAPLGLGIAYSTKGSTFFLDGQDDDALHWLNLATEQIERSIGPLTQAQEYRLTGQAGLALGNARRQQARIYKDRGDAERSKELYQAARTAYATCIAQGQDEQGQERDDEILTQKIIKLCKDYDQRTADDMRTLQVTQQ